MSSKTFVVPNISCGHCVHTVEMEVGDIAGVKNVSADEQSKRVTVEWEAPASWEQIESVLREINYPPADTIQIS
ncbi:MAG: heavy-metal-associated domain-containing protein [Chloroflexota bacterium]